MARKVLGYLAVLEALTIIPLVYFLPFSQIALVAAIGILFALQAVSICAVVGRIWLLSLQALNLITCGVGLGLALSLDGDVLRSSGVIAVLCLSQLLIGYFQLPDRPLKRSFAAQLLAIASTLIAWMIIKKSGVLLTGEATPSHLQSGLRFLFSGPLALVAIAYLPTRAGAGNFKLAMVGVCAGQYGMGLLELGVALQSPTLNVIGLFFMSLFFLLLMRAILSGFRPTIKNHNNRID